jgi:ribosomal protein S18 acetylase RimI-like enzyme
MPLAIRPATLQDTPALSRICLLTADAGQSAEELHTVKDLPGTVSALPYVNLSSCWGFVLVDSDGPQGDQVVGYVLGSSWVRKFEAEAEEKWWPRMRELYPVSTATGATTSSTVTDNAPSMQYTPSDIYYFNFIAHPTTTGQDVIDAAGPAFMLIGILPDYQRQGWGRQMVEAAARKVREDLGNVKGSWIWAWNDSRNEEATK